MDKESWCLNSDGTVRHDNVELYHLAPAPRESPTADLLVSTESPNHTDEKPESDKDMKTAAVMPVEGDTIGLAYDHVELNFFLNGKNMEIPVRNIRGTVYPALYGMFLIFFFYKTLHKFGKIYYICVGSLYSKVKIKKSFNKFKIPYNYIFRVKLTCKEFNMSK